MMLSRKRIETLFLTGLMITMFVGCDNDFIDLDSDLINRDIATNFNIDSVAYDVIAYTVPLGPVQTNNLPMNYIGAFNDPNYGLTTQSLVSQLNLSVPDPNFGNSTVLDSVILYIPYFSTLIGVDDDGIVDYELDSIFGDEKFDLTIYESDYFMRSFDPEGSFDDVQLYYSNKSISPTDDISEELLMGTLIMPTQSIEVSSLSIPLTNVDGDTTQVLPPGLRIKLDNDYWQEKIIDTVGSTELSNQNNFNEYFRGIYFKSNAVENNGSLIGFNLNDPNARITMHYTRDAIGGGEDEEESDQDQATYEFSFGPIVANFTENEFRFNIPQGDEDNGDARLYLKGNEGSRATIRLFDGMDNQGNSIFENFKESFANYDSNGEFVSFKKLVNEANLIFYVDQQAVVGEEPDRIYIYDVDNTQPLQDFVLGGVVQNNPSFSLSTHLGILEREGDEPDGKGIRYKMRITNHIINLIESDSTNVELGLAVSSNVNVEATNSQGVVQTTDGSEQFVPLSSILSPRGTILHGNNSEDEEKRLFLQIFFTCLETDEDCN